MSTETPLGLIVPVDADSPDGPAQIGGNAEKSDALLLAGGGASKHLLQEAEVTRTSTAFGSFSTALKVTLAKVLKGQLLAITVRGFVKCSVASAGTVALSINGTTLAVSEKALGTPTTFRRVYTPGNNEGLSITEEGLTPASPLGALLNMPGNQWQGPTTWVIAADATNFTVELVAKASSGTVTASQVYLLAEPVG